VEPEIEGSSPRSQENAIGAYPVDLNAHTYSYLLEITTEFSILLGPRSVDAIIPLSPLTNIRYHMQH
jgi:hypothetical protein